MKIEVCDLCGREVDEYNRTKVIIKEYKGTRYDGISVYPVKRKISGVICNDCLELLKERKHKQIPKVPIKGGLMENKLVCPNCGQALKWEE